MSAADRLRKLANDAQPLADEDVLDLLEHEDGQALIDATKLAADCLDALRELVAHTHPALPREKYVTAHLYHDDLLAARKALAQAQERFGKEET